MNKALCDTFIFLSFDVLSKMKKARYVQHQPLEESFTDNLILELKYRHPTEIYCQTFSKQLEGKNGADWEWWLTDSTYSQWLGLRVQAKVLNLTSDKFSHLHYKSGHSYQATKLKKAAEKDGLIPIYCFYSDVPPNAKEWLQIDLLETYGCSLTTIDQVEKWRRKGKINDFSSVMSNSLPWHWLVCAEGFSYPGKRKMNLPERAYGLLGSKTIIEDIEMAEQSGIRSFPPDYVRGAMEGYKTDPPKDIRGILVIKGE